MFDRLTALTLDYCTTAIRDYTLQYHQHSYQYDHDMAELDVRIPQLGAGMPRLQTLSLGPGVSCAPEMIRGCTKLQHVMFYHDMDGFDWVADWMRSMGRLSVPSFSCSLSEWVVDPALITDDESVLFTQAARWAHGLKGVRSVKFEVRDGHVPLPELLHPLAAGLGEEVLELTLEGCEISTAKEAASALHCLLMMQRLERLTIAFRAGPATPLPTEDTLCVLLAPLPPLRACAPALQRVTLRLPVQASLPRGGTISWQLTEELCRANPGLSIEFVKDTWALAGAM